MGGRLAYDKNKENEVRGEKPQRNMLGVPCSEVASDQKRCTNMSK